MNDLLVQHVEGFDLCMLETWQIYTIDLEIFVLLNFRVLNFHVKIFSWSRIPMKNFDSSTFPGLVIWNETMHAKSTNSLHADFVATMQLLANY